jgi:predicted PurR-regulated permease PerM
MTLDSKQMANWLISGLAILALLYVGRPFLVPITFAVLAWAVLNALTQALARFGLPRPLAWASSLVLIVCALYLVAQVIGTEAVDVKNQAPLYLSRLESLTASWLAFLKLGPAPNFRDLFSNLNMAGWVGQAAASAGDFVFSLAMVVVFVGFLLAEQRQLPHKMARLFSDVESRREAGKVVGAIAHQVQTYLGVCTFISAIMAGATYTLLIALHVNFAGFWALVMFLLTYIPTVGAAGVLLPALVSLLQFGTFGPALVIAIVLGVLHFVLANVVATVLLGRTLNLSPFAIILSLTFWGLIWGVAGLFLAVPITGAVTIVARQVEGLNWFAIILGGPERPRGVKAKRL